MKETRQLALLKATVGKKASFKPGQEEAIQALLDKKRVLVIQKTGWGKSIVYFIATKMFRDQNLGISIVISPLLALMNNQMEAAERLGLVAETVNTNNIDDWQKIYERIINDEIDILFISPERLSNHEFMDNVLNKITTSISMLIIDEAHCISDWGHDFRPDYKRIKSIISLMPQNVPILATTATANKRVEEDIKSQLGQKMIVQRGELTRETLAIEVLRLDKKEERLAWISQNIRKLGKVGIIYCLTKRDCTMVAEWLDYNAINVKKYNTDVSPEERLLTEKEFMDNKIEVLVATTAYGMGVDKPDINFIIHFQKPGNPIAYYQQIGRAGRGIDYAVAILMAGAEDDNITQFFIDSAFPSKEDLIKVLSIIESKDTVKKHEIVNAMNISLSKIDLCLKFLDIDKAIIKEGSSYRRSINQWLPSSKEADEITQIRNDELMKMNEFMKTSECYMKFMAEELDDEHACECGKCSNCIGKSLFGTYPSSKEVQLALRFLKQSYFIILPRKKWPVGKQIDSKNSIKEDFQMQDGKVLTNYGDVAYGRSVADGKYKHGKFDEELIIASVSLLEDWVRENDIQWVTYIPSIRRPLLVSTFAKQVAEGLNLPCIDSIIKSNNSVEQKTLKNSNALFENAWNSFEVVVDSIKAQNVLLIDDMVDSRWTMTVCAYKLIDSGSGKVYPFALANSAGGE